MNAQQQRFYKIYTDAKKALEKNPNDSEAEFIVDLYDASKNLHRKNEDLKAQVKALHEELTDAQKIASNQYHKIDMLESKVERYQATANAAATGTKLPSAKAWLDTIINPTAGSKNTDAEPV